MFYLVWPLPDASSSRSWNIAMYRFIQHIEMFTASRRAPQYITCPVKELHWSCQTAPPEINDNLIFSCQKNFFSILPFFHVLSEGIPVVSFWLHDRVYQLPRDMVARKEIDAEN